MDLKVKQWSLFIILIGIALVIFALGDSKEIYEGITCSFLGFIPLFAAAVVVMKALNIKDEHNFLKSGKF